MSYYDLQDRIREEREKPKDYGYVGTVQISAMEYRELVANVEYARNCAREEHEAYMTLNSRNSELSRTIDEQKKVMERITEHNDKLKAFIKENNLEDKYKAWVYEKSEAEMEFD